MKKSFLTILFVYLSFLFAVNIHAQSFSITNVSFDTNIISLSWGNVTNRYIISRSTSLITGQWEYAGIVLSTNDSVIANNYDNCFYRIRKVSVVNFADTNFEKAVREQITNKFSPTNLVYDLDVNTITSLDVSSKSITSLLGIAEFIALTNLYCYNNLISNLDVSANANLQSLSCYNNQLTNLNISGCVYLQNLTCQHNLLTNLDFSANTQLAMLLCYSNLLNNLNVSGHTSLTSLYCNVNQLTNLNVSGCNNLTFMDTSQNPFTNLNISWCSSLTDLIASNCTNLISLSCDHNHLTNLDASVNVKLTRLRADHNFITNLNITGCTNLVDVFLDLNQLTYLTIPGTSVTSLFVSANLLTNLEVSAYTNLQALGCGDSKLKTLNVSANAKLQQLYCRFCGLINSLNLYSNTNLITVYADYNSLSEIVLRNTNTPPATFLYDAGVTIRQGP